MCLEDIKLGRELTVQTRTVTVTAGSAQKIAQQNDRRTRMFIATDGVAFAAIGPRVQPPAATAGIGIPTARPWIMLRIEEWGISLTDEWFLFTGAATMIITIMEATLERQ